MGFGFVFLVFGECVVVFVVLIFCFENMLYFIVVLVLIVFGGIKS